MPTLETPSDKSLDQIRREVGAEGVPPIQQVPPLQVPQFSDIDLSRQQVVSLAPIPRPAEQGTSKVTEFIRSLKALKGREVSVAIRKKQTGLSQGWSFKGAERIEYDNFSMEDLMMQTATQYGNGRYQFAFSINKEDGAIDQTFSFTEDIDLSGLELTQKTPIHQEAALVRQTDDSSSKLMIAFMEKMDTRFNSLLEVIAKQGENRQIEALARVEAALTKQQVTPVIPQNNLAEVSQSFERMMNLAMKVSGAGNANSPMNSVEFAKESLGLLKTGYDTAAAMFKPMVEQAMDAKSLLAGGEGGEEGERPPTSMMDVIQNMGTKVFTNVLGGLVNKYTGGGAVPGLEEQHSIPSPTGDPAINYLRQVLAQSVQLFVANRPPQEIAQWLRGAIPPMHIAQLASMAVDSVIKEVPQLGSYRMALAETLTHLKPRLPAPHPQRPTSPQASQPTSPSTPPTPPESKPADVVVPVRMVTPKEIKDIPIGGDGLPDLG